ncbi:MAG: ThiF family adenylyltransferase [Parachlamydia sp.]|nr:ThiF family adenylyltransferase [Parachlamydia sp.]
MEFDYHTAFQRTLGWVTEAELQSLKQKRIAIAGNGGVGGHYVMTLTRLGIGKFTLADADTFELSNFNRQVGASMLTIGKSKVEVMAEMARAINPELEITIFKENITAANADKFLEDADYFLDGFDLWALEERAHVFELCAHKGIVATTVGPFGMGAALMNFHPLGTTFENYFRLKGHPLTEQALRFLIGLAPRSLHRHYLVDPSYVDLAHHRGPSTPMAVNACAAIAGTEILKVLLGRGKVYWAPWAVQCDLYQNKTVRTWRPGGYYNPLQLLSSALIRRILQKRSGS